MQPPHVPHELTVSQYCVLLWLAFTADVHTDVIDGILNIHLLCSTVALTKQLLAACTTQLLVLIDDATASTSALLYLLQPQ